ncbi:MAG: helix-turn-helix domain-containing protein [bacterium]|nr:helix-turn-helix domain-containing protein [bacterium]
MSEPILVQSADRLKGDSLPLRYTQGRNVNLPLHRHDCCELVIVLHGTATHVTDAGSFPLSAGDVFVLAPGQTHGYRDGAGFYIANLQYAPSLLQPLLDDLQRVPGYHLLFETGPAVRRGKQLMAPGHLNAEELASCSELCMRLGKEYENRPPGWQAVCRALFYELVSFLSRYCTRTHEADESLHARMGHVLAYIREHYHERITLAQLCSIAQSSTTRFIGEFQRVTGYTPIDFVIRLRVLKAAKLLREDPRRSVTNVAYQTGFDDSAYFSRKFRQIMGTSPRQYRTALQRDARLLQAHETPSVT